MIRLHKCRTWFDEQAFAEAVAPFGVQVVAGKVPGAKAVPSKVFDSRLRPNTFVTYLWKQRSHQHISIGCQHSGCLQF
jgi:hypothetical protein